MKEERGKKRKKKRLPGYFVSWFASKIISIGVAEFEVGIIYICIVKKCFEKHFLFLVIFKSWKIQLGIRLMKKKKERKKKFLFRFYP